jgi:hypothetical protein
LRVGESMTEAGSEQVRSPWWLRVMYAVLLLAALSLVLLVLKDVIAAVEPEGGELHHLFVFDLAWPVFVIAGLATLLAGVAALVVGRLRSNPRLTRYGVWAMAVIVVAVVLIVVTESQQPPAPEHS